MRILPVLLRCACICGLLWLGGVGLSGMRFRLRVAGRGVVRASADVCASLRYCRGCAPICGLLPLRLSGNPGFARLVPPVP